MEMTTDVRTFKAGSMQEALEIVRRELGHDAVILHTRQTEKRSLWPWSSRRQEVEITAGLGIPVRPIVKSEGQAPVAAATKLLAPPPPLLDSPPPRHSVAPPKWSPNDVIPDDPPASVPVSGARKPGASPAVNRLADGPLKTIAARARLNPPPPAHAAPADRGVEDRLDQLQRMILELGRERPQAALQNVPTELFHLFTALIDADVDDDLARELVSRVKQHASPSQLRRREAMWTLLSALVERDFRVSGAIRPVQGRRKVAALVGPTGVGKTTTLAKLAANFHLRDGVKVGLVTVDTYRIAAVEQLKTYAELIQLPMRVVATPDEMTRALDELSGLDLVLIDTAGRSPQDELKIQELQRFLAAGRVDEVHLVLSLTSGTRSLTNVAASFAPVGVTSLILTKLDEAPGLGGLYNLARRINTPISYVTTGQAVPEDIEPAVAQRLMRLTLGQDLLGTPTAH
jgi:flagellar biosynthesis protein FlhF